jgi:hypothetical protein
MKRTGLQILTALVALTVTSILPLASQEIFDDQSHPLRSYDFQGPVGTEWSSQMRAATPSGRQFLGHFSNGAVKLKLTELPEHEEITVSFDLYIINSWDGNQRFRKDCAPQGCPVGPDIWSYGIEGGEVFLTTTFSNISSMGYYHEQAYPGTYPGPSVAPRTGATEANTLGYRFFGDAVYHIEKTFKHNDPNLSFFFSASGLQDMSDESWGIDNVHITYRKESHEPDLSFQGEL